MSGYVYALRSETSRLVKIGRTAQAPMMRLREINATPHYAAVGPWHIAECREVLNPVAEEGALHRAFAAARSSEVPGANELFAIDLGAALDALAGIPADRCMRGANLSRFRQDAELQIYLSALFQASALDTFADIQGAWTLSMYPSTNGGRYFTVNVDKHEVALALLPRSGEEPLHALIVDQLVLEYEDTVRWFEDRGGHTRDPQDLYRSAKEGAVRIDWLGPLSDAAAVFAQPGVRRALVAYWYDMLLPLRDEQRRSFQARWHDHNAASDLFAHLRERRRKAAGS